MIFLVIGILSVWFAAMCVLIPRAIAEDRRFKAITREFREWEVENDKAIAVFKAVNRDYIASCRHVAEEAKMGWWDEFVSWHGFYIGGS